MSLLLNGAVFRAADFNKDGNADLITNINGYFDVMLGNGAGSFKAPLTTKASAVVSFAVGDFNNDGILDVASFNGGYQTFLGNGNGTFRSGPSSPFAMLPGMPNPALGATITQLYAAGLRNNGEADLVGLFGPDDGFCGDGGVVVALGNGKGGFTNTSYHRTGGFTANAIITDLTGDKLPEIVVQNEEGGTFSVLLNIGAGNFSPAQNYKSPEGIAGTFTVGDLAGNGKADVTLASQQGVEVFVNRGEGQLDGPRTFEIDLVPEGPLGATDLNHDGIPDLAFRAYPANDPRWSSCIIYDSVFVGLSQSNGHAALQALEFVPNTSGLETDKFGLGDFNNDGNVDIVQQYFVPGEDSDQIEVNFNNAKGQFFGPGPSTGAVGGPIVVGNFNADKFADVAVLGNTYYIMSGTGTGTWVRGGTFSLGSGVVPAAIAIDVNGDGKMDIVALDEENNAVDVLLGEGNGKFQAVKEYPTIESPVALSFGDFNRDGKPDLVVGGGSEVSILLNNGAGGFKAGTTYSAGGPVVGVTAVDLRGNGDDDVVVADSKDNKLFLLQGNGRGALGTASNFSAAGGLPTSVISADMNRDGAPDIIVANSSTQGFMILYNQGGTAVGLDISNIHPKSGQAVTLTAHVSATIAGAGIPTGTVAFKDGGTTLSTASLSGGKATFTTTKLSVGTHQLLVDYFGTGTFLPGVSFTSAVTVTK
jgi:Bacterial Ig-like domain (group 3)/FG-GAP-like repeat